MITNAINAERIKLLSTKSPYWCVGVVVVLAVLISVFIGLAAASDGSGGGFKASDYTIGLTQIGVIVLMIMAVLAMTSEYRFGTIRTTFQAIPKRQTVMSAKAAVYGGLSFGVALVLGVITILLGKALSGDGGSDIDLLGGVAIRQYWGVPVYALLCVLIGLGIGALVRQTAGAIVVLLIWTLALEGILSVIPKVKVVAPYLPFTNATHFLDGGTSVGESTGPDFPWNEYGSLIYFAVWALAIFGAGIYVTNKRDA